MATKQRRLPSVLNPQEVALILQQLSGRDRLIIELLYGSGLRVNECLGLRGKDIDFTHLSSPKTRKPALGRAGFKGGMRASTRLSCLLSFCPFLSSPLSYPLLNPV